MVDKKSSRKRKKYIFTLKSINTEKIDQRYGIMLLSNITEEEPNPETTTMVEDLVEHKRTPEVISFLDESKHLKKCSVSMIDFSSGNPHDKTRVYNCFWCHHPIPKNIRPIGCPVRYVPHQAVKSYYSELSRDTYTIKENITEKRSQELEKKKDKRVSLLKRGYYLTDGAFCSFNCCMAFIECRENKRNPLYTNSFSLLLKIYNSMHDDKITVIDSAPRLRKLIPYGGELTITQFRQTFHRVEYIDHGVLVDYPKFHSLGTLFEERLKF